MKGDDCGRALGAYRILFYALLLVVSLARLGSTCKVAEIPLALWQPVGIFEVWHLAPLSASSWNALVLLFLVTTVLSMLGLLSFLSMLLAGLSGFVTLNYSQCFGGGTHAVQIVAIMLLLWPWTGAGHFLSLDGLIWKRTHPDFQPQHYGQGIWMGRFLLVMAFTLAGIAKLKLGGLEWLDGVSLQNYLIRVMTVADMSSNELFGRPATLYLIRHVATLQAASWSIVVLEILAPLALWKPAKFRWIIVLLLGTQVGIYVTMGVNFAMYLSLYAFWIPERWLLKARQTSA